MSEKAYLSNICPAWTIEAQEEALAKAVPDWPKGVRVYRDILGPSARKAHSTEALVQRASALRSTGRKGASETLWMADLSVFDWSPKGFMSGLAEAAARNMTVVAVDTGRRIAPDAGAVELSAALDEFKRGRDRRPGGGGRMVGATASKVARLADTLRRVALIEPDWAKPNEEISTESLLLRAGRKPHGRRDVIPMAYATAAKYLDHRPLVQARAIGEARRQLAYAEAVEERKAKAAARAARKAAKETTNGQA